MATGFRHAGIPRLDGDLAVLILPKLPAVLIILVIEHIAIAKSFGRIFGYAVTPSQEIMAQGVANLFSPFVGGYVCTGSFGASAVLSKAGVRTPLAGVVSALVLVLALYALTAVFAFIPLAVLAGLIIHATSDLVTSPRSLHRYWQLSPFELLIWVVGLAVALFHSLEVSIYVTTALSLGLVLARMARTPGSFLGRVRIYMVPACDKEPTTPGPSDRSGPAMEMSQRPQTKDTMKSYDAFLPLQRNDGSNPDVPLEAPYPGVFIYRFAETLNYTNQAQHVDLMASCITSRTRRTTPEDPSTTASDRLWNIQTPKSSVQRGTSSPSCGDEASPSSTATSTDALPPLRAVLLDCSAVNNMDITSVQGLVDLRTTLARHAAPAVVEWHLASIRNRWTRRALAVAGFGFPAAAAAVEGSTALERWTPTYAVAGSLASAGGMPATRLGDEEKSGEGSGGRGLQPVIGVDRPFFHVGLAEAVDVAVRNAKAKDQLPGEPNSPSGS
ncbi:hypothetical protein ACHAQA_002221 [Verticillium albo-atrum]